MNLSPNMHFLSLMLGLLLLSLQVHTSPTPLKKTIRSVRIERIRQPNYVPDGPGALKKAYAKFGIIPSGISFDSFEDFTPFSSDNDRNTVSKAMQANETGIVTNTPTNNDAEYLSPVTIGGQKFVMNLDTGSSDTWVFNTQLSEDAKRGHSIFDPAKSKTFSDLEDATFNITYGDASFAFGRVGIDTVDIGGATVQKQAVGLPTDVSGSFILDQASDGLIGLGFDELNTVEPQQQKSFFTNLAANLDEPVLAAQLKKGAPGSYEFGAIDETKFNGDLVTIPVNNSRGFWEVKSTMFKVGKDEQLRRITKGVGSAIADTGTTLMLVNEDIVNAYYDQVDNARSVYAAGGFIFPCNATLPDLYVSLGDTHLARIPGDLMNFSKVGLSTETGEELCFGGVQSNSGSGLQVFGDVLFKAIFVVFDLRGPSLHVAGHA
ncbi:aspartic protease PEP3 [Coccidioides immitis RS]|uniref:Aspartic protease PEP3 n=4 Tax=Coccidioides immitis TaxID=5501 RepID=A0A0E1RY32_COCIM|nr:aspartic protease PEP3 [Coccidioides immitis RS]KMP00157.1 aspergillopepsin A [Coccidioides immitis RMSCC 2394]KMU81756.1 aspergillopepsin A [Coccidioides immitis RMSCC 3703]KMU84339.1 aspergillopepsin A [Coccidioides immitis H538.4]TPX26743.1 tethering complex subunit [Coccidioides immitis]EAS34957.1 aspartic protease PEP3 [Coccidioides immitis RS]